MSKLIKFVGIPVLAIGLLLATSSTKAEAGHGWFRSGGTYYQSYRPVYRSNYVPRIQYRTYYGGRYYHNDTHLDYHAPTYRAHNGHLHYTPGHYDVHRSGHWH